MIENYEVILWEYIYFRLAENTDAKFGILK